jgi:hypothetical protein
MSGWPETDGGAEAIGWPGWLVRERSLGGPKADVGYRAATRRRSSTRSPSQTAAFGRRGDSSFWRDPDGELVPRHLPKLRPDWNWAAEHRNFHRQFVAGSIDLTDDTGEVREGPVHYADQISRRIGYGSVGHLDLQFQIF